MKRSTESIREHFVGCKGLARSSEKTVHLLILEKLLLEVFNSLHQINPAFMWELFEGKHGGGGVIGYISGRGVPPTVSTWDG